MSFILEFKEEQRDAAKPSIDQTILEFFYLLGLPDRCRSASKAPTMRCWDVFIMKFSCPVKGIEDIPGLSKKVSATVLILVNS